MVWALKILLIHQSFPAQFKHLAPALVIQGYEVTALTLCKDLPAVWNGVQVIQYAVARGSTLGIHSWVYYTETKVIRGEAALREAIKFIHVCIAGNIGASPQRTGIDCVR